ncbi:MAG: hypothetical protein WD995_06930 [Gemmatimonadota bacterium]
MEFGGAWSVLWIAVPGFFVGILLADSVRRIFSEDDKLLRRIFANQPVTMTAVATALGSVLVWAVLRVLGFM